jgi:hypothetical protein
MKAKAHFSVRPANVIVLPYPVLMIVEIDMHLFSQR